MYFWDLSTSLLAYGILLVSFLGWGRMLAVALDIECVSQEGFFSQVWLGWAVVLFILSLLQLVFPLSAVVSLCVYGGGVLFFFLYRGIVCLNFFKERLLLCSFFLPVLFLLSVWFATRAMTDPQFYDSGLYYFNSIRWLNEYPIVKGLGNLHGRLAFNQSFFSYVASLNLYPWFGHGYNIALSFLVVLLLAECSWAFMRVSSRLINKKNCDLDLYLRILFIPVVIRIANEAKLSSPSADIASSLLQIVLFLHIVKLLQGENHTRESTSLLKILIILGVTAITVKLNNVMYGSAILGLSLGWFFLQSSVGYGTRIRSLLKTTIIAGAIFGLWAGRGVLLSGCPLYPSTFLCGEYEWSVPLQRVQDMANWIHSWARYPGKHWREVLGNWDWLSPWLAMIVTRRAIMYSLVLTLVGVMTTFGIMKIYGKERGRLVPILSLIILPLVMSVLFWFFMAPDPRFAGSLFYLLPIASLLPLMYLLVQGGRRSCQIGLFLLFVTVNLHTLSSLYQYLRSPVFDASLVGYQPIPEVVLKTKSTWSGLNVFLPAAGDQCFDAPLPATPRLNPRLHLLGDDLGSGFSVVEKK